MDVEGIRYGPDVGGSDLESRRRDGRPPGVGVGDRHLRALAAPHGRIMGSGVSAVLDTCTVEEVERAADAFSYFGLVELAQLTKHVIGIDWQEADDSREHRLCLAFYGLESALWAAFERRYVEAPDEFSPIEGGDDGPLGRHTCPGEVVVHEQNGVCSLGADCTGDLSPASARLHREPARELCPSGPDWAT